MPAVAAAISAALWLAVAAVGVTTLLMYLYQNGR
jgi:hypothetical protein